MKLNLTGAVVGAAALASLAYAPVVHAVSIDFDGGSIPGPSVAEPTLGAGFDIVTGDFANPAGSSPLGTTPGVNTPYTMEIEINTNAGETFVAAEDHSASIDYVFEIVAPTTLRATNSSTLNPADVLVGAAIQWFAADGVTAISGILNPGSASTSVQTNTNLANGESVILRVTWTDIKDTGVGIKPGPVASKINLDFNVSAVPVPAALPLFASALLGLGMLSRRRRNR